MPRKKKLTPISIRTHNNGYELTVKDRSYMFFTVEQLVGGVYLHVAIGEMDFIDKNVSVALIESVAKWKEKGDALKANARLVSDLRQAQWSEKIAERGRASANERAENAEKERERYRVENINLRMELDLLKNKQKLIEESLIGRKSVGQKDKTITKPAKKADQVKPKRTGKSRYARK